MNRRLNFEKLYMFILLCVTLVMLVIIGVQWMILRTGARQLSDQLTYKRWSDTDRLASISMYYADTDNVDDEVIAHTRYNIAKAMKEQGAEDDDEATRDSIDSYCAKAKLTITNEKKSAECVAYGVGGDFFMFHPLNLEYGTYFNESELMDDYIIMDRETAWTVFGGDDVEGKFVYVGDIPLKVRGVYTRDDSKLDEFAGNGSPSIFVSYSMLKQLSAQAVPITCYEVTMPNPVDNFAMGILQDASVVDKEKVVFVENSKRFGYESYINVYKERNARSMKTTSIAYPYWENLARAKEDELMPIAMWQIWEMAVLGSIWFVTIIALMIIHKPTKETFVKIADFIELKIHRLRNKRKKKREDLKDEI